MLRNLLFTQMLAMVERCLNPSKQSKREGPKKSKKERKRQEKRNNKEGEKSGKESEEEGRGKKEGKGKETHEKRTRRPKAHTRESNPRPLDTKTGALLLHYLTCGGTGFIHYIDLQSMAKTASRTPRRSLKARNVAQKEEKRNH